MTPRLRRKKRCHDVAVVLALTAVLCVLTASRLSASQFSTSQPTADKKDKAQGRLLYGKVLDPQDNPVAGSIVYLTNMRTHEVKTYIVGQEGTYRFPGLTNVDYEVYAQADGRKSDTKSVSQFDDRPQVYVDLRIAAR